MTMLNNHWITVGVERGFNEIKDIYPLIDGRGFVAGSFAAWMSGRQSAVTPNDVDIFAITDTAWNELAKLLGICLRCPAECSSIVWRIDCPDRKPIQIIRPHPQWRRFPDDVINSFDLSVSRAVLVNPTTLMIDEGVGDVDGKLLLINDPLRSLKRVMKYSVRGIQFNDWELLKLFRAWDEIPDTKKAEILLKAEQEAFPPSLGPITDDYFYDEDEYFQGE